MSADLQAQLAEALAAHELVPGIRDLTLHCACGWESSEDGPRREELNAHVAEALAALVSAHVAQVREGLADEIEALCSDSPERPEYTTANHAYVNAARIVRPSVGPREQGGGSMSEPSECEHFGTVWKGDQWYCHDCGEPRGDGGDSVHMEITPEPSTVDAGGLSEEEVAAIDSGLENTGCHGFMGDHPELYAAVDRIAADREERARAEALEEAADAWDSDDPDHLQHLRDLAAAEYRVGGPSMPAIWLRNRASSAPKEER